jgi:hypothetical protein
MEDLVAAAEAENLQIILAAEVEVLDKRGLTELGQTCGQTQVVLGLTAKALMVATDQAVREVEEKAEMELHHQFLELL